MPSLIDTVKLLFGAFTKRDINAMVAMLTDDVSWEYEAPAELATAGIWRTRAGVMKYLAAMATQSSDVELDLQEYLASDDAVVVFGRYRAIVRATGIGVDSPIAAHFQFRDGKIARVVQVTNTGAMLAALRGQGTGTLSENKRLVTDYVSALSGTAKTPDLVGKYVADASLAQHIADTEAAFPNYELIVEDISGEKDLVTVRAEFRGVHRGAFAGIEPTGKPVSAALIIIYKVEGGKIVHHWMQLDMFSLLQQLQNHPEKLALAQTTS